jgi:hypothetical protein
MGKKIFTKYICLGDHRKGTKKGRETSPFRALDGFNETRLTLLG